MNFIQDIKDLCAFIIKMHNENKEEVFTDKLGPSKEVWKFLAFYEGIGYLINMAKIQGKDLKELSKINDAKMNILFADQPYEGNEKQEVLDSLKILSDFLDTL
jgi:hypothetical protein